MTNPSFKEKLASKKPLILTGYKLKSHQKFLPSLQVFTLFGQVKKISKKRTYLYYNGIALLVSRKRTLEQLELTIATLLIEMSNPSSMSWKEDVPLQRLRVFLKALNDKKYLFLDETIESRSKLENLLKKIETRRKNFFSDDLSEDSDSDSDQKKAVDIEKTSLLLKRSCLKKQNKNLNNLLEDSQHILTIAKELKISGLILRKRSLIIHDTQEDLEHLKKELNEINDAIKNSKKVFEIQELIKNHKNTFYIAQYRGIHYNKKLWDRNARKKHRALHEINIPIFSRSVLEKAGLKSINDYLNAYKNDTLIINKLITIAEDLKQKLVQLRFSGPVVFKDQKYSSYAHALQYLYTSSYAGFTKFIKTQIDQDLQFYLLNEYIPFVSFGDKPYHPLKYAYGAKLYADHKTDRLEPRWRQNGRAERPYVGQVYTSLHPISDFLGSDQPFHIPTLNYSAEISIQKIVLPESENCFPAYLAENRVISRVCTKFPSFKRQENDRNSHYPEHYLSKYGLDKSNFFKYQTIFTEFSPHSEKYQVAFDNLVEHLCAYQEVSLIESARIEAKSRNGILVYRDINGGFTLDPPIFVRDEKTRDEIDALKFNKKEIAKLSGLNNFDEIQLLSIQNSFKTLLTFQNKTKLTEKLFSKSQLIDPEESQKRQLLLSEIKKRRSNAS